MRCCFAGCTGAVMTARTIRDDPGMVKSRRCPCVYVMAQVALTSGRHMGWGLPGRKGAIVTATAHAINFVVVD